uniref:Uncharacterized protein n=1 Tax=Guillardia theta TaxID=55529 RepID=A0A7S4PEM7_GUITH
MFEDAFELRDKSTVEKELEHWEREQTCITVDHVDGGRLDHRAEEEPTKVNGKEDEEASRPEKQDQSVMDEIIHSQRRQINQLRRDKALLLEKVQSLQQQLSHTSHTPPSSHADNRTSHQELGGQEGKEQEEQGFSISKTLEMFASRNLKRFLLVFFLLVGVLVLLYRVEGDLDEDAKRQQEGWEGQQLTGQQLLLLLQPLIRECPALEVSCLDRHSTSFNKLIVDSKSQVHGKSSKECEKERTKLEEELTTLRKQCRGR